MPGDLRNPEFLFPYHYDSRYEYSAVPFVFLDLDRVYSISLSELGRKPFPHEIKGLQDYVIRKGLIHAHSGDFEAGVQEFFKNLCCAKKVVKKYARYE